MAYGYGVVINGQPLNYAEKAALEVGTHKSFNILLIVQKKA